jgi:glycosidase
MSELLEKKPPRIRRLVRPSAEPPDARPAKAVLRRPEIDNRDHSLPAICYLRPADMGEPAGWSGHFVRAAEMGFDSVLLASPFAASDGLVLDYEVLNFCSGGGDALAALAASAHAAREAGVTLMLDLDISRMGAGAMLLDTHPDWFTPDGAGAAFRFLATNDAMVDWWDARIAAFQEAGIAGFRCLNAPAISAAIWARLTGAAHTREASTKFLAWTPGSTADAVTKLRGAGFDYGFSSSCWWDFSAAWLNEDAGRIARIGPAIALTRPLEEVFPADAAARRRALHFAAFYGAGWLMPMGFQLGGGEVSALFDLTAEVLALNQLRKRNEILRGAKSAEILSSPGSPVAILRRGPPGAAALALAVNASLEKSVTFETRVLKRILSGGARLLLVRDGAAQPGPDAGPARHLQGLHRAPARCRAMGFDVVYFTPIHPIGRINRKGRNNAVTAAPAIPAAPMPSARRRRPRRGASGTGHAGGFPRFVAACKSLGMEVALDFAVQCSPDHPWLKQHPQWFKRRPDGSMRYAENPPKKYEDIVNPSISTSEDAGALWNALRDVVLFWVDQGVKHLPGRQSAHQAVPVLGMADPRSAASPSRRDLPGRGLHPAEADEGPGQARLLAVLHLFHLAQHARWELEQYLNELTAYPERDFFGRISSSIRRTSCPISCRAFRPGCSRSRVALAATLSSCTASITASSCCEHEPIPGKEEYLDSEKYEIKVRDWDKPGNIKPYITALNRARRQNAALQQDDPLWYKDAIIYQLHVKAFADSNNDGIGDFAGLTEKLDYLQELGVTALWLLPFYPSPRPRRRLRHRRLWRRQSRFRHDEGFPALHRRSQEARPAGHHRAGHQPHLRPARLVPARPPQRARNRARATSMSGATPTRNTRARGSSSPTPRSRTGPGIRKPGLYWHRFFSHQPDLNFDNPRVVSAVSGHALLARHSASTASGSTPCPICRARRHQQRKPAETHAILKKLRAELDAYPRASMLLAEANQWPEDVQEYFGAATNATWPFHFPLMPRIYMAIAQEDRFPITDICARRRTSRANCQWAIFLRNHDELTLEMVTDVERDYLWSTYANDRARASISASAAGWRR